MKSLTFYNPIGLHVSRLSRQSVTDGEASPFSQRMKSFLVIISRISQSVLGLYNQVNGAQFLAKDRGFFSVLHSIKDNNTARTWS
jgi:hypothetical protein